MHGIVFDGRDRTRALEPLALAGAAFALISILPAEGDRSATPSPILWLTRTGRWVFALPMLVFGWQHFEYAQFIATLIPAWIPGHRFWVYFTAVGFILAGLAILAETGGRLAAFWLGIMFLLWTVLLLAPRVASAPHNRDEWTSAFVAMAFSGASFIVATTLGRGEAMPDVSRVGRGQKASPLPAGLLPAGTLGLLLLAFFLPARAAASDPNLELLRAKDQALLDAIAPGDRKLWDEALAPDAVYVDENGTIMDRAEFLKQLEPLPAAASGTLRIVSYSARVLGDLATVVHTDDEQENYHGQVLRARYLMTETWRWESGMWKLHMVHAYAMLKDPPAIAIYAKALQEYEGRYSGGSDLAYLIEWDGKQLVGGRAGRPMTPLLVEVRDVLFVVGQPRTRKIFQRDENGRITGFVDRREGEDLVWRRERSSGP
jgi:uncharacterized membrane protein YphA (DoxX/SURF4 family)/ketosteroid isomerase-like protein